MVLRKGRGKAWQAGSGLATLNNFSRLWGVGTVPGFLVPGYGALGDRGIVAQSESLVVEVAVWALDWLSSI